MLLSEVRKTTIEKKPWWIEEASDEILALRDMFSAVQGYKLDFSPITHYPDMLYMYNDTKFKYLDNPKYQDEIDRINEILEHKHIKNSRNILCAISENCVENANGNGVFDNFKLSIRNIAYNNIQDKMWGYLGNLYFSPKIAKDFVPALYEYCVNNFIIYAVDDMTEEEQNKEYVQFLIHKAIKDYEELKQLAEVLSL